MFLQLFILLAWSTAIKAGTLTTTLASSANSVSACGTVYGTSTPRTVLTTSTTTTGVPKFSLILSTSIPTVTVTPAAATTTETAVKQVTVTVTASTVTDTVSTTSTATETETATLRVTQFKTETETTVSSTTSTSIIPKPTNFVTVEESTGFTDYGTINKRREADAVLLKLFRRAAPKPVCAPVNQKLTPTSVKCATTVRVTYTLKLVVVRPTTTVTGSKSTVTVTSTSTQTSTDTVMPTKAMTTEYFSTTVTTTTNELVTDYRTTTTTSVVTASSVETIVAACQDLTNVLGPRLSNGNYIVNTAYYDGTGTAVGSQSYLNAYDCCAACWNTPGCQYSAFSLSYQQCDMVIKGPSTTCDNRNFSAGRFYQTSSQYSLNGVLSNGPCGKLVDTYIIPS